MSRSINPLLVDKPTIIEPPRRNFARKADDVAGADFAKQLSDVEAAAPTKEASKSEYIRAADSGRIDRSGSVVNDSDDDFSFDDFIDLINPLHHIPIVGAIYRELTGDTIKPVSLIAGDIAFGAISGNIILSGITAIISAALEQHTGEDPLTQVADALFGSDGSEETEPTMVAEAEPASAVETQAVKKVAAAPEVKLPYGGVMDASSLAAAKSPIAHVAASTQRPATRIGNTIYTGPLLGNAARVAPVPTSTISPIAPSDSTAIASRSTPATIPGSTPTNSQTLGSMMQESANAGGGNSDKLPPDLVRDMMMMALDKYKTASGMAPSEMKTAVPN